MLGMNERLNFSFRRDSKERAISTDYAGCNQKDDKVTIKCICYAPEFVVSVGTMNRKETFTVR